MDPKTANLDPKLREAYERIMGTAVPAPAQKTNAQTPSNPTVKPTQTTPLQTPKLQVQEVKHEPLNMPKFEPLPPLPPQPQLQTPLNEMVQSPVFSVKNPFVEPLPPPPDILGKDTNTILNNDSPKKKSKLKPIFIALGGLIFFVIYGVIWAKVFSLF